MPTRYQVRRGTASAWVTANTVLAQGEMGMETDTGAFKFGDGTTAWASLAYAGGGASSLAVGAYPVSVGPWPQDDSGWTTGLIGPGSAPAMRGVPNAPALTLMAIANKLHLPSSINALLESPPTTLQAQHDATASGGICYIIPGYIYREQVSVTKPITFVGRGRVSIRGSDDWSTGGAAGNTWTNASGIYHSSLSMPSFSTDATQGTPTNTYSQNHRNVLFVDGVGYQLVNSASPSAGQWAMGTSTGGDGGTTHAFIPINPAGHKIEVGVRAPLFLPTGNNALTLDGIDMRHIPGSGVGQPGAIDPSSITTAQVSILNCMIGWAHGHGLAMGGMNPGPFVQDSIFHDCGTAGLSCPGNTNSLYKRCIFFNNGISTYGWDSGYNSGGIKVAGGSGHDVYDGLIAFNNTQSGIWFDIQTDNAVMENSVCWDNWPLNVSIEISAFITVRNNVIFRTPGQASGLTNADIGLYSSTSRQIEIYGNLLMHEPFCAKLHWDVRGDAPPGNGNGIHFHDNKIIGRYHAADQAGASDVAVYWAEGTGGLAITAIAAGANPSITVSSTASLTTGDIITISGVVGAVECNGDFAVTVVNATHFTIVLAAHTAYVSGGVVTNVYSATNLEYNNQFGYPGVVASNLWSYQEADTRWWKGVAPVSINTLVLWVAQLKLGAGQWNAAAVVQTGFPGNGNGEVYMPDADRVAYLRKFGLIP